MTKQSHKTKKIALAKLTTRKDAASIVNAVYTKHDPLDKKSVGALFSCGYLNSLGSFLKSSN